VAGGLGSPEDESDVVARCGGAGRESCERRVDVGGVGETVGGAEETVGSVQETLTVEETVSDVEETVGSVGRRFDRRDVGGVTCSSTTVSDDDADACLVGGLEDVMVLDLLDPSRRLRGVARSLEAAVKLQ
jgi:hypothetical protein